MSHGIPLRPGTAGDFDAIYELLAHVFHEDSEGFRDAEKIVLETDRSLICDDEGIVAGHATAYTRDLTVPGGVVPAAHISGVGVRATHRRRGLLTSMMRRQLTEIHEAGREPVAVLWASETTIYPRFGYGPAAARLKLFIANREVRLPAPPATPPRLRMGDPAGLIPEMSRIYDEVRTTRVGWSDRAEHWWRYLVYDPKDLRDGATRLNAVIHDSPDGPSGYALWRVKDDWNHHGPNADVLVREVVATDPAAYRELWRFLLSIDLTRKVTFRNAALDEPLQYLVDEPRRLGAVLADSLYLRLVDLPAALAARRYAAPVDVVLEVTDPLIDANTGRWRLTGGPDGATCSRTTDPADLECSVTDLGAAYLGGTSLATLAAAGRVRLLTANDPSLAFGWHRPPSATETF
ncbi:GNAT family N-acetyltransferase [Actinoplanes sp. NPDC051851]|uniref:GNAT family N-acetyltransferase n=1 Tax=Actinoplanes sp. NPDC051851 TaxID=3154753 RepID=UPI0034453A6E